MGPFTFVHPYASPGEVLPFAQMVLDPRFLWDQPGIFGIENVHGSHVTARFMVQHRLDHRFRNVHPLHQLVPIEVQLLTTSAGCQLEDLCQGRLARTLAQSVSNLKGMFFGRELEEVANIDQNRRPVDYE